MFFCWRTKLFVDHINDYSYQTNWRIPSIRVPCMIWSGPQENNCASTGGRVSCTWLSIFIAFLSTITRNQKQKPAMQDKIRKKGITKKQRLFSYEIQLYWKSLTKILALIPIITLGLLFINWRNARMHMFNNFKIPSTVELIGWTFFMVR